LLNLRLFTLESARFPGSEGSALHPLLNTVLLMVHPLLDARIVRAVRLGLSQSNPGGQD
jgi:hypothetical protein